MPSYLQSVVYHLRHCDQAPTRRSSHAAKLPRRSLVLVRRSFLLAKLQWWTAGLARTSLSVFRFVCYAMRFKTHRSRFVRATRSTEPHTPTQITSIFLGPFSLLFVCIFADSSRSTQRQHASRWSPTKSLRCVSSHWLTRSITRVRRTTASYTSCGRKTRSWRSKHLCSGMRCVEFYFILVSRGCFFELNSFRMYI